MLQIYLPYKENVFLLPELLTVALYYHINIFDVAYDIFIQIFAESFEVKTEFKANEDVPQQAEQAGDWDAQAKSEDDRYSRKRSYDDSRGYGYYEHREERR